MKLDPRQRGVLSLTLLALLLIAVLLPFVAGRDARHLSAYEEGIEDASRLHDILVESGSTRALLSTPHLLDDVADPADALLVILGPERRYDRSEAARIISFLEAGGNILIADDTAFGTDITIAAGYAFGSQPVLDSRNHLNEPRLVVSDVQVGANSFRVLFNEPTNLIPLKGSADVPHTVLARSSEASPPDGSYLDTNGDGKIDIDQAGPFELVVRATVGRGTIVLVSDPGVFMDGQMTASEFQNDAFARALVGSLVQGDGIILIDESRHASPPAYAFLENGMRTAARMTMGSMSWFFIGIIFAGAFAAWYFTRTTEDWSHHTFNIGGESAVPATVRPDADRAQRFARRRINEKYNIPMEQVQAMTAEELVAATGERALSEIAAGTSRVDPASFFHSTVPPEASQ